MQGSNKMREAKEKIHGYGGEVQRVDRADGGRLSAMMVPNRSIR